MEEKNKPFAQVYNRLYGHYGEQDWWPADNDFEIIIGAILTQNTSWNNVEKSINNLKRQGQCHAQALMQIELDQLALLIRSSGYFNQKATRLKNVAEWYLLQGGYEGLQRLDQYKLRTQLLGLNGIGPETADDIVLYAFEHPVFVIDAYTRRIFSRLQLLDESQSYEKLQQLFHQQLPLHSKLYQQYHALIVAHAKQHCLKKPLCAGCPLKVSCSYEAAPH